MKFSVGYQIFDDDYFIDKIIEYKDSISEVYFSWSDFPSGRNNQIKRWDMSPYEAGEKQYKDLLRLSEENIKLSVLFNATCYGENAQARSFYEKIGDTVDFLNEKFTISSLTTTSPLIAGFIKNNFSEIDVRASVNMCIGSVEGMEYVKDLFDSFYIKRELNRDFEKISELKAWCDENGKVLYALANSGCLNNCSAHTFHDNLVSHESEISKMDNGFFFEGVCRKFLEKNENLKRFADVTGFIRPEDVHLYEGIFPSLKLATRVNQNPVNVMRAYIEFGRYMGSTFDLLEPNHSAAANPYILDNGKIKSSVEDGKLKYDISDALHKIEEVLYVNK